MWPAVVSAAVRPIFIAIRTSTMKPWRRVCVTMTGASAMATSSEARDLDARVLELVAADCCGPVRPSPPPEPPGREPASGDRPDDPPAPARSDRVHLPPVVGASAEGARRRGGGLR